MKLKRSRTHLAASGLVALLLLAVGLPLMARKQQNNAAPEAKSAAQYVGTDVCKTCHEDLYKKNFEATPHFKTTLEDGHGCESCHGPDRSTWKGAATSARSSDSRIFLNRKSTSSA